MANSSNKKVLVVRFDRETLPGFVQVPAALEGDCVELLRLAGSVVKIPFSETKVVCFVRDFEAGETWRDHRAFTTRPKTAGLWLRFFFRDGDWLEGIAPNNLLLVENNGFQAVPPDPTFQNQRVFVPRAALSNVQVLGVIGSPLRRPAKKAVEDQMKMFD
ncbi:MAG: hypothetical protein JO307_00210 [Bryobacterales bacterium]|nr:hypothetical protein [Bryobacterales bacterium]MBV9401349.1 hypothetical protein [Bryobacterales bacterium]